MSRSSTFVYKRICEPKIHFSLILALARHNKSQNRSRGLSKSYFPRLVRNKVYKMYSVFFLWFIASSLLMTSANIFNDLQEAQKFVEELDYDYSTVAAQQRPAADLLWYDYGGVGGGNGDGGGGGGGGSNALIGGGGGYYGSGYYGGGGGGGGGFSTSGMAPAVLIGAEKRGGASQSSSANIWFGPRLGRRKRRGGGSTINGGLVQPVDGNAFAPAAMTPPQESMAAVSLSTAAGQAVVSDLINSAPWVLVPVVENSLFGQQMKQNARSGRSSSEDDAGGDDFARPSSRHTVRSPPFSPRLGRQTTVTGPQVPRLGREAFPYRRDVRGVSYQQQNGTPTSRRQQQQAANAAAAAVPIAVESAVGTAARGAGRAA